MKPRELRKHHADAVPGVQRTSSYWVFDHGPYSVWLHGNEIVVYIRIPRPADTFGATTIAKSLEHKAASRIDAVRVFYDACRLAMINAVPKEIED